MIRIKGGRRQPRYYYLKEKGAEKLVKFITNMGKEDIQDKIITKEPPKETKVSKLVENINKMKEASNSITKLIEKIKKGK